MQGPPPSPSGPSVLAMSQPAQTGSERWRFMPTEELPRLTKRVRESAKWVFALLRKLSAGPPGGYELVKPCRVGWGTYFRASQTVQSRVRHLFFGQSNRA